MEPLISTFEQLEQFFSMEIKQQARKSNLK